MRVFNSREMDRYAKDQGFTDEALMDIADKVGRGEVDADLGQGVVKIRVARQGQGKSRGFRFIILLKQGERLIFFHAFAKNRQANISTEHLQVIRGVARDYLNRSDEELDLLVQARELREIIREEQPIQN